jgi:hypothetical protein
MEQRAADMGQRQRLAQRAVPQFIRIEHRQLLARGRVVRQQARQGQMLQQRRLTLLEAVKQPPHGTGRAPIDRERGLGFRVPAIAEDPGAGGDDADGMAVAVEFDRAPAERVRPEIDSQSPTHVPLALYHSKISFLKT